MTAVRTTGSTARGRDGATRTSEFTELARTIRASGLLRRRYGYYWAKLVGLPLALSAMILVFIVVGDTWWQLVTAAAFACLFTQIAFLGHDAAHRQIFVSGRWNDWTSLVLGDLLVGMSYGWWQHKHTRHHANPNRVGSDPDIELPVIVLTADQASRTAPGPIVWLRAHQGLFFFPDCSRRTRSSSATSTASGSASGMCSPVRSSSSGAIWSRSDGTGPAASRCRSGAVGRIRRDAARLLRSAHDLGVVSGAFLRLRRNGVLPRDRARTPAPRDLVASGIVGGSLAFGHHAPTVRGQHVRAPSEERPRTPAGTRTQTEAIVSRLPLPLGYGGPGVDHPVPR